MPRSGKTLITPDEVGGIEKYGASSPKGAEYLHEKINTKYTDD